ncbi:tRNA pseudouridine synthase A [Streptomyces badius]
MSDQAEPGFVRVRLDLSYDGKDFSGWAKQTSRRTVQGEIEDALRTVTRSAVTYDLTVAGVRTPGCTRAARWPMSICRRRSGPSTRRSC